MSTAVLNRRAASGTPLAHVRRSVRALRPAAKQIAGQAERGAEHHADAQPRGQVGRAEQLAQQRPALRGRRAGRVRRRLEERGLQGKGIELRWAGMHTPLLGTASRWVDARVPGLDARRPG